MTVRPAGSLLSIDLAAVTGWAIGGFADVRPSCGSWRFSVSDPYDKQARQFAELENTLIRAFDGPWADVRVAVHAEPFRAQSMVEARAGLGRVAVFRMECWRRNIRVLEQNEATVRKEILGRGRAPTDAMKAIVMRWAVAEGIVCPDHNAADAAVLWRWARDELVRQRLARQAA